MSNLFANGGDGFIKLGGKLNEASAVNLTFSEAYYVIEENFLELRLYLDEGTTGIKKINEKDYQFSPTIATLKITTKEYKQVYNNSETIKRPTLTDEWLAVHLQSTFRAEQPFKGFIRFSNLSDQDCKRLITGEDFDGTAFDKAQMEFLLKQAVRLEPIEALNKLKDFSPAKKGFERKSVSPLQRVQQYTELVTSDDWNKFIELTQKMEQHEYDTFMLMFGIGSLK